MPCPNHADVDEGLSRCLRCRESFCPDCVVLLGGDPHCGPCKHEHLRDILSGTTGTFDLAGLGRRFGAWLLDGFIQGCLAYAVLIPMQMVVMLVMGAAAGTTGGDDAAAGVMGLGLMMVYMLGSMVITVGIHVLYEGLLLRYRGQTVGKMALGLKVVTVDGEDISPRQAWGRAGVKAFLANTCVLVDDLPAFFTHERTAVHDLVAKTRVARMRG